MNKQQEYLNAITILYDEHITDNLDNFRKNSWNDKSCCTNIKNFIESVEGQLGLTFVDLPAGINTTEKNIVLMETDKDGFVIEKRIAAFRYAFGIYGGCFVSLKDYATNKYIRSFDKGCR